jgi:two-component system cell cycle response regulator CtrA
MRILIIEDDKVTSDLLTRVLENEGAICEQVYTGSAGIIACKTQADHTYDVILLDIVLPDQSGCQVLKSIRTMGCKTPIIGLSGLKTTEDKTRCLDLGSDDYIAKPFDKNELLARIRAVMRRTYGNTSSTIEIGELVIDLVRKHVKTKSGKVVDFTEKEYMMFELMAQRLGAIISKSTFINNLYQGLERPEEKIIDVFTCKMRTKIANAVGNWQRYLHTVWGRGYTLEYRPLEICKSKKVVLKSHAA